MLGAPSDGGANMAHIRESRPDSGRHIGPFAPDVCPLALDVLMETETRVTRPRPRVKGPRPRMETETQG